MKLEKKNVYRSKPWLCVKQNLPNIIENVAQSKNCYAHQNRNPFQSASFFAFFFSLNWVAVLTIEKNTFPDTSYKANKLPYILLISKSLCLFFSQKELSILSSPNDAWKASVFTFLEDLS